MFFYLLVQWKTLHALSHTLCTRQKYVTLFSLINKGDNINRFVEFVHLEKWMLGINYGIMESGAIGICAWHSCLLSWSVWLGPHRGIPYWGLSASREIDCTNWERGECAIGHLQGGACASCNDFLFIGVKCLDAVVAWWGISAGKWVDNLPLRFFLQSPATK